MPNPYRHADWIAFRNQVITFDGFQCVRCRRTAANGVTLQVHHKEYANGKLPWEYAISQCETLCKGCHAEQHGHVMPRSGWSVIGWDDLGDLSGECDLCKTNFRYAFAVLHPTWGSLVVGTDCCDKLTATDEASQYMEARARSRNRLARFVQSKRWKSDDHGGSLLREAGSFYRVDADGAVFRISINGHTGRRSFQSELEARKHLFGIMVSGEAAAFISRQRERERVAALRAERSALGLNALAS